MAASVVHGESPGRQPSLEPLNGEDDVLCELDAEFKRSKSELIHRFLKDQEELNRKFAEYELASDEDGEDSGDSSSRSSQSSGHLESYEKQEIFDVLQDLEDKEMPDNLSTASAVNSSSDERSLSDCGNPASYEDTDIAEEEGELDENWNVTDHRLNIEAYPDEFYDKYSRQGCQKLAQGGGYEPPPSLHPVDSVRSPQAQPRKSKKNKDSNQARKVKKVLVKKNIRPQTSMGVRALPDGDHLLFNSPDPEYGTAIQPKSNLGTRLTFHDSLRLKKISWTGASEDHPEMGRLSISASVHKLPPRSHTPGGRLKTCASPLTPNTTLAMMGVSEQQRRRGGSGTRDHHQPELSHVRRSKAPVDLLELSRAATPVRPDSSLSTYSRLSVDLTSDQFSSYRSRQGTPTTSGPHLMRSVYPGDRGSGRIVMTPTLADVKSGKKRPIAVLKLPPLDSGVVNRAIGATLDSGGRQPPLVSPATAKSNTVATPSAI